MPKAPQTSAESSCIFFSVQLTMLNSESKIQSQPIVTATTGAAHGSTISRRTNHLPRKSRTSALREHRRADDARSPATVNVMISVFSERVPEVLVAPRGSEVVEADELAGERAADRVRHAQVHRPDRAGRRQRATTKRTAGEIRSGPRTRRSRAGDVVAAGRLRGAPPLSPRRDPASLTNR